VLTCCILYHFGSFRPKIVTTNTKVDRREKGRERKALKAAQLDRAIENELLERLKQVSENEIYNYPEQQYKTVLDKATGKYEGTLTR
jgi:protein MAK16